MQAARGTALIPARRAGLLALVALLVVVVDAVTKVLVVAHLEGGPPETFGPLTLEVSRNSGAAFSFAEGATLLFTFVAVAVIVVIVRTASRLRSTGWAVSLGLLLGGAVGNLSDRLLRAPGFGRGAVVDFLHLPHFATFNAADSAITVGAALAVLLSLRGIEVDGTRRAATAAEPADEDPAADQR